MSCHSFVGSSGCGKSTASFLIADKLFCLWFELYVAEGCQMTPKAQQLRRHELLKKEENFEDYRQRLSRLVCAKALVLAYLKMTIEITPYTVT